MNDVDVLTRNWWAVFFRGLLGVSFGLTTIMWPGLSFAALVIVFGAYAFADGLLSIFGALRGTRDDSPRWALALRGVLGLGAGIVTLFWPAISAFALLYVIAAWAIVGGLFEIAAAIRLRRTITGEWLLGLSGVLSVGLGVALMLFPGPGALALVLWIGAYALVFGLLLAILGLRLRSSGRRWESRGGLGAIGAEPASHP